MSSRDNHVGFADRRASICRVALLSSSKQLLKSEASFGDKRLAHSKAYMLFGGTILTSTGKNSDLMAVPKFSCGPLLAKWSMVDSAVRMVSFTTAFAIRFWS